MISNLLIIFLAMLVAGGCAGASALGDGRTKLGPSGDEPKVRKPALIRLEDVGPGGMYQGEESLQKLIVVAEYLHSEGIPFHVALIPRFVEPEKGYDVGMADDTPYARSFVATIKKMQSLGAIVGVHGYTHQTGYTASGTGFEFFDPDRNPNVPDTYGFARDRMARAISLFEKAGIVPGFWETPHYTASETQYQAFGEEAGLLYENVQRHVPVHNYRVYHRDGAKTRGFVAVPTPLGYIGGGVTPEKMLKYLDKEKNRQLASFFYHPFKEFGYIEKVRDEKGGVSYAYDRNSPLHVIVKSIKERGYTFINVYSLVGFIPAHRLEGLESGDGVRIFAGRFGEDRKRVILVWNSKGGRWRTFQYTAFSHMPRLIEAFKEERGIIRGWPPEGYRVPLAADFNGDGGDDLLVFNPVRGSYITAENRGGYLVPREESFFGLEGMETPEMMVGDFNGDGLDDIAIFDRENFRVGLAFSSGRGFENIAWQHPTLLKRPGLKLVCGDFNGDLKSDIAVLDGISGEWWVMLAGRDGVFLPSQNPWMYDWKSGGDWRPFASDVNGDGMWDLVVYNGSGHWLVALSQGGRFVRWGEYGPWGGGEKAIPLVADFNGDGRSDLAIVEEAGGGGGVLDLALSYMGR